MEFASTSPLKKFAEADDPLLQFFLCDSADERLSLLLHHQDIEGFAAVHYDKLVCFYLPRLFYHFDPCTNKRQRLATFVAGDSTYDMVKASCALDALTADKLIFVPSDCDAYGYFKTGSTLTPELLFKIHQNVDLPEKPTWKSTSIDPPQFDENNQVIKSLGTASSDSFSPARILALPRVLPLLRGHGLTAQDLHTMQQDALMCYHPAAWEWFLMIRDHVSVSSDFYVLPGLRSYGLWRGAAEAFAVSLHLPIVPHIMDAVAEDIDRRVSPYRPPSSNEPSSSRKRSRPVDDPTPDTTTNLPAVSQATAVPPLSTTQQSSTPSAATAAHPISSTHTAGLADQTLIHPLATHQPTPCIPTTAPVANHIPQFDEISVESEQATEKNSFSGDVKATLALLFANIIIDPTGKPVDVQPGVLLPEFRQTLFASTKKDALYNDFVVIFNTTRINFQKSDHYLARFVSPTFMPSQTVFNLFIHGRLVCKNLVFYNEVELKGALSLIVFGTPYGKSDFDGVDKTLLEALNEQHDEHRTKKEITVNNKLRFDSCIDDVLCTVANFLVLAHSLVIIPTWGIDTTNNPTIVNFFHTMCKEITRADTALLISMHAINHRHLHHVFFTFFNDILTKYGSILQATPAKSHYRLNQKMIQVCLYEDVFACYSDVFGAIKRFAKSSALHSPFTGEPETWRKFGSGKDDLSRIKPDPKLRDNDNKGRFRSPYDGAGSGNPKYGESQGWLSLVGSSPDVIRQFKIPSGVKSFCLRYAFLGSQCRFGDNCKFSHPSYPNDFTAQEQSLLTTYVQENSDKFRFARDSRQRTANTRTGRQTPVPGASDGSTSARSQTVSSSAGVGTIP